MISSIWRTDKTSNTHLICSFGLVRDLIKHFKIGVQDGYSMSANRSPETANHEVVRTVLVKGKYLFGVSDLIRLKLKENLS